MFIPILFKFIALFVPFFKFLEFFYEFNDGSFKLCVLGFIAVIFF